MTNRFSSKLRGRAALASVMLCATLWIGCDGEPPSAATLASHLEHQLPGAEFRRDSHVRLGRFSLALVRGALRVAGDQQDARRVLKNVRRVDVSTYEVVSLPPLQGVSMPRAFEKSISKSGWTPLVKESDEGERLWVYYREDDEGSIRNLYVVELDAAELTVIDLAGRLDRVVAEFVAEDPDGFLSELGA